MTQWGIIIERVGTWLALAGGALLLGIFAIVIANGRWPYFLLDLRGRLQLAASLFGSLAFIAELAFFAMPGLLLVLIGRRLQGRR